jgi:lysophospholipid acyltransferase (LPLAT)-like uncharacterized protein
MERNARRRGAGDGLVGWVGAFLLRALASSWRVTFEGGDPFAPSPPGPRLGAFWHRNVLIATAVFRDRGYTTTVSRSRDGDLITAVLTRLGYRPPSRGSSSQGGVAAARRVTRLLQAGVTAAVVTDGPRGPARRSKPGVVTLARLTGVSITPVAFTAHPCLRFRSWDEMLLPLPFARVTCRLSTPIPVARNTPPDADEQIAQTLDHTLSQMTDSPDAQTTR